MFSTAIALVALTIVGCLVFTLHNSIVRTKKARLASQIQADIQKPEMDVDQLMSNLEEVRRVVSRIAEVSPDTIEQNPDIFHRLDNVEAFLSEQIAKRMSDPNRSLADLYVRGDQYSRARRLANGEPGDSILTFDEAKKRRAWQ
ncbi:hypothetical protein [Marinobacter sp. P4B1]|uniref:hypothetical protein n=1 Tax=Marinobacter sp. P4B1 TaxID=1119533 RepID=UPI00071D660A|nr:hypothetical protein [Marinobacter sp. P4B1]KRW83720.1 hypothetical protein AQ621_16860 [Marinobacter sp. P4B1]